MKWLVSQERVQQRTVEQIMDMLVTMHVEPGQVQDAHRVMDVPVVGVPVHGRDPGFADDGSKLQLHRTQSQWQHQAEEDEK